MNNEFTKTELERYGRQMQLPEMGLAGQARLKRSSVLLVGLGGLGSPAATYLAAAGVGRLGLVDSDRVEGSNLHRQILYSTNQVGQLKTDVAAQKLSELNPHIQLDKHPYRFAAANARELVRAYDVILDGTDNFLTRYLVNDACVLENKPLVSAAILNYEGQLSVFQKPGPCYRCLFAEPPPQNTVPSCAEAGVLGVMPGVLGTLQATEVLKLILQIGEPTAGFLIQYNALEMNFSRFAISRDPGCAVCGDSASIHDVREVNEVCAASVLEISAHDLKEKIAHDLPHIIDVRESYEREIDRIENSTLVSLGELGNYIFDFAPSEEIVVYCQSGARGKKAVEILTKKGFLNVKNLGGGIRSWSQL